MDLVTLVPAAVAFVGSCVAQKCADATLMAAWKRIQPLLGRDGGGVQTDMPSALPSELAAEAELVFGHAAPLRRAQMARTALEGARVLWVDDHPENNVWERRLLGAFGVDITTAESTRSALALVSASTFDLIFSDIDRGDAPDEGVHRLPDIRREAPTTPVIFYVGQVKQSSGPPSGAFGITDDPGELLHLVLDELERTRV